MTLMISIVIGFLFLRMTEKVNLYASIFLLVFPLSLYLDYQFVFHAQAFSSQFYLPISVFAFCAGSIGLWNFYKKWEMGRHLVTIMALLGLCSWNDGSYAIFGALVPLLIEEFGVQSKRKTMSPLNFITFLCALSIWHEYDGTLEKGHLGLLTLALAFLVFVSANFNRFLMSLPLFILSSKISPSLSVASYSFFGLGTVIYIVLRAKILPDDLLKRTYTNPLVDRYKTVLDNISAGVEPRALREQTEKIQASPSKVGPPHKGLAPSLAALCILTLATVLVIIGGANV